MAGWLAFAKEFVKDRTYKTERTNDTNLMHLCHPIRHGLHTSLQIVGHYPVFVQYTPTKHYHVYAFRCL